MNHFWRTAVCVLALSTALAPALSEAKRLGGGSSSGMQRSAPSKGTPAQNTPAQTPQTPQQGATAAAPMAGAAATGAAAAAGKRSWMGPIAGLAAGLGIAALMSHLGLGEAFGNFLMIALLVMAALAAFAWFKRRSNGSGQRPALAGAAAGAGAGGGFGNAASQPDGAMQRSAHSVSWPGATSAGTQGSAAASFGQAAAAPAAASFPADFDRAGFERIARMIFIRMQAANDRADLNDLREFTTPEMFASIRADLQDRGSKPQETDVVEVRAEIIDFDREAQRDVVSVRYTGLIREEAGAQAAPFDEVWHLIQPSDRSRNWAIAGIQQAG
ncbi:Tim44 domain-containing protein [Sphaerotilus sp.]|uniref:Tim44 domain-containing protein n=1 Tax=Sphaerotilus sp. TaxID=2093942 RepID=UPI002ACEE5D9|nr:TIM44-like domain-containing protein [Sphaerotilus sp.]MDZ7855718.1 TIM44-like domain-containing protein [Sphaerotilus sp.]